MTRRLFVFFSVLFLAAPTSAAVIDMEEFSPSGFTLVPFSSSQGYNLTASSGVISAVANSQPNVPNTGSNTLLINGGSPASFTLSRADSQPFDLLSLLAAEGRNTNTGFFQFASTAIEVEGTYALGGTISTTLLLDSVAQEDASLDFQSFVLSGFTGLSQAVFTGQGGQSNGYAFSLDDIEVQEAAVPIPEPASAAIWSALGVAGLLGIRRRRKQRS